MFARLYFGEVAPKRDVWIMMAQQGARKWVDVGHEGGPPSQRMPSDARGLNA